MEIPLPVEVLAASPVWDELDGGCLVVACSGGRDSVALARAAHQLVVDPSFTERFSDLVSVELWHLDHGLRTASPHDAAFVDRLARQLQIPVTIERAELGRYLADNGGNTEELARNERYRRLLAHLQKVRPGTPRPYRAVTAHHLGDQAETVLFNLLRGTHLIGLRGIAPVRDTLIHRPWLSLDPTELDPYLTELGQEYLADETNTDTRLARNKLRQLVFPLLREINPQADEHVARLADMARIAQRYIDASLADLPVEPFTERTIDRWLPLIGWPCGEYDAFRLNDGWPSSDLAALFLARELKQRLGSLTSADYDALTSWTLDAHQPLAIRGYAVTRPDACVLTIASPQRSAGPVPELVLRSGEVLVIGGLQATLAEPRAEEWQLYQARRREPWEQLRHWPRALGELTEVPPEHPGWHCFLHPEVPRPLLLRGWRPGDWIELAGGGTKKIGDVFTDAKIPPCFREVWAVLVAADGGVAWVPGVADSKWMQIPGGTRPGFFISLRDRR